MNAKNEHIRNGLGSVRPYVYGRSDLLDFVTKTFDSVELERNAVTNGFHVETRIGDSVIVLVAMEPSYEAATRASIYVYVRDVDETYRRAIAAGGTSIH